MKTALATLSLITAFTATGCAQTMPLKQYGSLSDAQRADFQACYDEVYGTLIDSFKMTSPQPRTGPTAEEFNAMSDIQRLEAMTRKLDDIDKIIGRIEKRQNASSAICAYRLGIDPVTTP